MRSQLSCVRAGETGFIHCRVVVVLTLKTAALRHCNTIYLNNCVCPVPLCYQVPLCYHSHMKPVSTEGKCSREAALSLVILILEHKSDDLSIIGDKLLLKTQNCIQLERYFLRDLQS